MDGHLSEDVLLQLAGGRLTGPEFEQASAHLDQCADCRRTIGALRSFIPGGNPAGDLSEAGAEGAPAAKRYGHYTVLEFLGEGSMGAVFLAHDPKLRRRVALKTLKEERMGNADSRARFLRESHSLARISHPNVVSVHDVGTVDGSLFIAMDYVEGTTLREWLAESPRSWREILGVFKAAARGLAAAHAAGVVHRDFKPDNTLIAPDGRVRVTDFGLARANETAPDPDETITAPGAMVGTPAYMSPEQFRGRSADAKSDQFSFCVSLYEALYGEQPFGGETLRERAKAVCAGQVHEPKHRHHAPRWLDRIVRKGLRVSPQERFESMDALLAAVELREQRTILFGPSVTRFVGGLVWLALALAGRAVGDDAGRRQVPGLFVYLGLALAILALQRGFRLARNRAYYVIPFLDVPFVWWERRQAVFAYLAVDHRIEAWGSVMLSASIFMVLIAVSVTTLDVWVVALATLVAVPLEVELTRLVRPDSLLSALYPIAPMGVLGLVGSLAAYRVRALVQTVRRSREG